MNSHKNARLTFARRLEMVHEITESGSSVPQAAADHGVTAPTVRKWLGRYLVGGLIETGSLSTLHCPGDCLVDRGVAPAALAATSDRPAGGRVGLDRQSGAGACRTVPVERPATKRTGSALRTRGTGRLTAHRHQEARPYRASWPLCDWQSARYGRWRWLGISVRRRGRSCPDCLHGDATRRDKRACRELPVRCRGLVRRTWRACAPIAIH